MTRIRRYFAGFAFLTLGASGAVSGCVGDMPVDGTTEPLDANAGVVEIDGTAGALPIADASELEDGLDDQPALPDGFVVKTEDLSVPTLSSFVVLATRSVVVRANGAVVGGNVGAGGTSTTGTLLSGETLGVLQDTTLDTSKGAYGKWLELDANVHAGILSTDHLTAGANVIHGTVSSFVAPPSVPGVGTVAPGTTVVTVAANQTVTLAPGAYGAVTVGLNGVLKLSGGTYQLASLTTNANDQVQAQAATTVVVAGLLHVGSNNAWGPTSASGLGATGLQVMVAASDLGSTAAATFDANVTIRGLLHAPSGTIRLGSNAHITGAVGAMDVDIGSNATITWQDGLSAACSGGCNDGNACTTDTCSNGTCAHTAITCAQSDQCHDVGTCNTTTGVCSNPPKANGTSCNDGDACTHTDTCNAGTCTGSNPVTCAASDQCHSAGTCNPSTGTCSNPNVANGTACNDGNACTTVDSCQSGTCSGASPVQCAASDQCHGVGTCNPSTGTCSNPAVPDGTACAGTNLCNRAYACMTGTCTGSNPVLCAPADQCHAAGACNPTSGMCSTPPLPDGTICSDGNACTQVDLCASGICAGTSPVTCAASDQCHVAGACNPANGTCSNPGAPDGTTCNDGNPCTQTDTCSLGVCAGNNPVVCTASDQCHVAGTCNTTTGTCSNPASPAGASCGDNSNHCAGASACDGSGACVQGQAPQANPPNQCFTSVCVPASGFVYTPIVGCDPYPTQSNDVFERQASIMGRVQTQTGGAVTGYTVTVYDAPATGSPRPDVSLTTAGDGSFRARLTSFPTSEPARSPPRHVIVRIDSPGALPLWRDTYLHVGDAADLGILVVATRDPKVTTIDSAGGTATDSQSLVSVVIPAGALTAPTPIRITVHTVRAAVPFPLPDSTVTTYAMTFEPEGQTFAVPVTMKIANYRSVPTTLTIPTAYVDTVNARWLDAGQAIWDGANFSIQATHFSSWDANLPDTDPKRPSGSGGPPPSPPPPCPPGTCCPQDDGNGPPPNADPGGPPGGGAPGNDGPGFPGPGAPPVGSRTHLASGTLRQDFFLPTYKRMGQSYGVTLGYDSLLTVGGDATTMPGGGYQAIPHASLLAHPRGIRLAQNLALRQPIDTGCSLFSGDTLPLNLLLTVTDSGQTRTSTITLPPGALDTEIKPATLIPLTSSNELAAAGFTRQTITLTATGGSCTAGGAAFGQGVPVQPPVPTPLESGPFMTLDRSVFVNHRHASPYGVGWGIEQVSKLYRSPWADRAVLVHGDGTEETFLPRVTTTVLQNEPFNVAVARDDSTGEVFQAFQPGNIQGFDPMTGLPTATPPITGLPFPSWPLAMAITYVGGVRHFVISLSVTGSDTGRLLDVDANANVRTLLLNQPTHFPVAGVAVANDLAFYVDGSPSGQNTSSGTLYRFQLSNPTPVAEALSLANGGETSLEPTQPLSGFRFGDPHGLAYVAGQGLYISDRQRDVVYLATPQQSDGKVGPSSTLTRVIGGYARFIAPLGEHAAGRRFTMNQPNYMAAGVDGTLWIASGFGIAAYDTQSQEARWLLHDATIDGSEIPYKLYQNNHLSFVPVGPTSLVLQDGAALLRADVALFSSEYDPTRTINVATTGTAALLDTTKDTEDDFDTSGRLVSRVRRTGEAMFTVGYVGTTDMVASIGAALSSGATNFVYDANNKIEAIFDSAGHITKLTVDSAGDLVTIGEPDGELNEFSYLSHRMATKTSPKGDITQYFFAADGTLASTVKPSPGDGYSVNPAYSQPDQRDANGRLFHAGNYIDPRGVMHTFTIDSRAAIDTETYVADAQQYVVANVKTPFNFSFSSGYDARPSTVMQRVNYVTVNGLATGRETTYDAQGRVLNVSAGHPGSGLTIFQSYVYDPNGRVITSYQGPGNDQFITTRDGNGRATRVFQAFGTTAVGPQTLLTYAGPNQQIDTMTVRGVTTTYSFDAAGNVAGTVDSIGRTTATTHDAAGNVASVNDGATTTTYFYDANNRLLRSLDALGNETSFGYTVSGCGCSQANLVTSIHTPDLPPGLNWSMEYDGEGRLAKTTDPDGRFETYAYEPTGELKQVIDRLGNATQSTHDQLGRTKTLVDALGRAHLSVYPVPTSGQWNGSTMMTGSASSTAATTDLTIPLTDGDYQIGSRIFDTYAIGGASRSLGYPQVSFYQDATIQVSYGMALDALGRVTSREDRAGLPFESATVFDHARQFVFEETGFSPDLPTAPARNFSSTKASGGAEIINLSYGSPFDLYDLTEMAGSYGGDDGSGEARYFYTPDQAGRLVNLQRKYLFPGTTSLNGVTDPPASTYAYAANNDRLVTLTNADGTHSMFYDTRGLLLQMAIPSEGAYTFDYDALGRNTTLTYADGHRREQQYDLEGHMTSRCYRYTNTALDRCYSATYDAVGNPLTMTDPEGTDVIAYDSLYRVRSITRQVSGASDVVETYNYNALGALNVNAPETTGITLDDKRSRIHGTGVTDTAPSAVMNKVNNVAVGVDAAGRITSLNGSTIAYDHHSVVGSITTGGVTETYHYDGTGHRVAREPSSAPNPNGELYVYEDQNIIARLDASGDPPNVLDTYLYDGIDHPLRVRRGGFIYYYEIDPAGNVRRLRDPAGADVGGYRYTAFGMLETPDAHTPLPIIDQALRWKGRWFVNQAGGLYDVRARWWSPMLGSFLSIDDLAYSAPTTTLWGWPLQNPVAVSDPTGRGPLDVLRCVASGRSLRDCWGDEGKRFCANSPWAGGCDCILYPFADGCGSGGSGGPGGSGGVGGGYRDGPFSVCRGFPAGSGERLNCCTHVCGLPTSLNPNVCTRFPTPEEQQCVRACMLQ